jgi:hypothetical protein
MPTETVPARLPAITDKDSPVQLALDGYDDIFSDFDARPYNERLLSDDFLHELRRAALDRSDEGLVLVLTLPKKDRKAAVERMIRDRILLHVRRHRTRLEQRLQEERRLGLRMLGAGVVCMFGAAWLNHAWPGGFWAGFGVVLLEPAGWFTFWEGLNLIVFRARDAGPELGFYRKLVAARVRFQDAPEALPVRP